MVVLATKVYVQGEARRRAMDSLGSIVANQLGELAVTTDVGLRHDDFPSVTVEGPDATVARSVLETEWGAIVPDLVEGETYIGTLEAWDTDGWTLDAGREVRIPVAELGLGPGDATQIVERFGIVQHQRLAFTWGDPPRLADDERDQLFEWQRGTDRVTVNSVTRAEAKRGVDRSGHARDILGIDRLGLLEQQIVCAPETDGPGLLAALGPRLPGQMRCIVTG